MTQQDPSLLGQRTEVRSLKEMLIEGLRSIESERPGTLDKLTVEKPRSRRIVARDRNELFDNPNLLAEIDKYSERLDSQWWVGTNNSEEQVETWLMRASQLAGLAVPMDFKLSLHSIENLERLVARGTRRRSRF